MPIDGVVPKVKYRSSVIAPVAGEIVTPTSPVTPLSVSDTAPLVRIRTAFDPVGTERAVKTPLVKTTSVSTAALPTPRLKTESLCTVSTWPALSTTVVLSRVSEVAAIVHLVCMRPHSQECENRQCNRAKEQHQPREPEATPVGSFSAEPLEASHPPIP